MEEQAAVTETVVAVETAAPVDGGQVETQADTSSASQPGVTSEVAAQKDDNVGNAIKAEVSRREAKLREQLEAEFAEKYKPYEAKAQHLDRVAKYAKYDNVDEFIAAMEQAERDEQIKVEAEKLKVDESVIREHFSPLRSELTETKQQLEQLRQEALTRQINAEYASLKEQHSDVDNYWPRMVELSGKGFNLSEAYDIASYKDRLAGVQKQTEAETIKKLQQNANSSPGSLGQEGSTHKTGFAALTPDQQREVIEKVKRGEIRSLDQIT